MGNTFVGSLPTSSVRTPPPFNVFLNATTKSLRASNPSMLTPPANALTTQLLLSELWETKKFLFLVFCQLLRLDCSILFVASDCMMGTALQLFVISFCTNVFCMDVTCVLSVLNLNESWLL